MTASTLSRLPAAVGGEWSGARVGKLARIWLGGVLAVLILGAAAASGSSTSFDPGALLLFTIVIGATVGGLRGGLVAAALSSLGALLYYVQPPWSGTPGNAARVLLLVGAGTLTVALVGSLRELADQLRSRVGARRDTADGVHGFVSNIVEAADDALFEAIVSHARRLVDAEFVVLTVLDPRTGRHVVRGVEGSPPSALGVEVLPGVGITGQAIRDRRLVVTGDEQTGPTSHPARERLRAMLPSSVAGRLGPPAAAQPSWPASDLPAASSRSLASVPALHAGLVAATLTVGRAAGRPAFADHHRLALEMVAPVVGLTVANWTLRRQLRESALRDPLSGLYSRAYFEAALDQLLALRRRTPPAGRRPLSVVLFDVDDFRKFNHVHGRRTGDAVVRAIGAVLRQRFRASDVVARVSGDSFAVVLDGAEAGFADRAAREIRARVQALELADEHGNQVRPSISAGCATFDDDAERSDAVLRAVEAALDTARWSGPGAIVSI